MIYSSQKMLILLLTSLADVPSILIVMLAASHECSRRADGHICVNL